MLKPQKIRALLIEHNIKQTDIAKDLELCPGSVNRVISRHYKSRRVMEAIANRLNMPFEKIWGQVA